MNLTKGGTQNRRICEAAFLSSDPSELLVFHLWISRDSSIGSWSASRIPLCLETDRRYRKPASVHAAFGKYFAKSDVLDSKYHRWLLDAFDERLQGDCDFNASFDADAVARRKEQACEFLEAPRRQLEAGA